MVVERNHPMAGILEMLILMLVLGSYTTVVLVSDSVTTVLPTIPQPSLSKMSSL